MRKIFNPEYCLYATVILLPVYLLKVVVFGLPINLLDLLVCYCLLLWLIKKKPSGKDIFLEFIKNKKYFLPIGLIFFGLILAMALNGNYRTGLGILASWFVLPILFSFMAAQILPEKRIINIFKAYFFSGLIVASLSIAFWLVGNVTFDGRLAGIFNSPNYLAMYLVPAIIIGSILFPENKKMYIPALGVITFSFYLTFSYAAWLAVALVLAYFLVKNKKYFTVGALILIFPAIIVLQFNTAKLQNLAYLKDRSSLASRIMIWQAADKILVDNRIIGIGPGNFQAKYLEYQKYFPPYLEWAVPHPHNLYLAMWLQAGISGLAGFLLLIFLWFRNIFKKDNQVLILMTSGIMIYILLHGVVDTTYFKNDLAMVFWLNFVYIFQ